MPPPLTRVTARLANVPEGQSIFGSYQQTPVYHKPVTVEAPIDEKGCVAVELPLAEARMVSVGPEEVKLFLEPGDQLHIEADVLDLPRSLRFSGKGAGNNQFLAALRARFPDNLRIDYKDLEADAFRRIVDQRRSELERFLDEGCSQYRLTPGFIAYYRAEITYEWANFVVSYPTDYMIANGNRNEGLPADYYDILDPVELVDEAAIGTTHYRIYLERNFWRMEEEAETRAFREQISEEQRRAFIQPHTITYLPDFIVRLEENQRRGDLIQPHNISYHLAKRLLHGRVLFFFLAGEIIEDLQEGRFDQGEQRLAEFLQDNPYPAYTEGRRGSRAGNSQAQTRGAGARLHPRGSPRQKRLPERFQRSGGFSGLLGELVRPVHRGSTPSGRDQTADPGPEGGLSEHLSGPRRRVAPGGR